MCIPRFLLPVVKASCEHNLNMSASSPPSSPIKSSYHFTPPLVYSPQLFTFILSSTNLQSPHLSISLACSAFPLNFNTQSALHNSILLPQSTPSLSSLLLSSWQVASARSAPHHVCLLFLFYSHHHLLPLFPLPSYFCFALCCLYAHMKQ